MSKEQVKASDKGICNRTFEPPNPASVVEEKDQFGWDKSVVKEKGTKFKGANFTPTQPASVIEAQDTVYGKSCGGKGFGATKNNKDWKQSNYEPPNPASIVEEPVSMFESTKVFIGKRHHQTEKPQDILEFFLKYWSDEGDTILDPTMGSGSTGVACNKLNRKFIGFELDPKIFEVAKGRLL